MNDIGPPGPGEIADPTENERTRLQRNFAELLQELRVAQAGVQILFAFLLTLPFGARFGIVDRFDKIVYLASLFAATAAAGMITAPVAYHRMLFRRGRKAELVRSAHQLASWGLASLFVAMVGAILLAVDVAAGRAPAVIIATVAAGVSASSGASCPGEPAASFAPTCPPPPRHPALSPADRSQRH